MSIVPRVERSVLVPYAAEQMFDLVNDLESYPKFLPWCASARLNSAESDQSVGTLEIHTRGIRQEFTTANELARPERLAMRLVSGPFRRLQGEWQFKALAEDATRVTLQVEFETSGGLRGLLLTPVFRDILNSLVDAFVKRARQLYGDEK